MPLHQTDAYVLRTYTLKEADKICVLLTRESGKVRGVAHGARRLRSRFGSSLELFTQVSVSYFQKENRELVSISSCEIIKSQFPAELSAELLGLLHYFAELIIEFVPDHEPNQRVYRLVIAAMDALDEASPDQLPALTRYCEVWMLKLAGFLPDFRTCSSCKVALQSDLPVWLGADGTPQCSECSKKKGEQILPDVKRVLDGLLAQSPQAFLSGHPEARAISQIGAIASRLIFRILERELKSPEIINQLKPTRNAIGSR